MMRPGDDDTRILLAQPSQHVIETRGARSQKEKANTLLGSQGQEGLGQPVISDIRLDRITAPTRRQGDDLFRKNQIRVFDNVSQARVPLHSPELWDVEGYHQVR